MAAVPAVIDRNSKRYTANKEPTPWKICSLRQDFGRVDLRVEIRQSLLMADETPILGMSSIHDPKELVGFLFFRSDKEVISHPTQKQRIRISTEIEMVSLEISVEEGAQDTGEN